LSFSKAPYLPRPFDATNIRSTLTQNDVIEIGRHYDQGAVPNADYIFYGSNLSEIVLSFNGTNANNELKNPYSNSTAKINCQPSLYHFLQTSAGANESTTLNSFGSVFIPRSRHPELTSELMECFESNIVGDMSTCEAVRKDPKFRWSILSNGSDVTSVAAESRGMSLVAFMELKALDEAGIKVESDREGKEKEQEQNRDSNPKPDTLSAVEITEKIDSRAGHGSREQLETEQDILQAEQHSQSGPQSNYRPEFTTSVIPPTTIFSSPPCQKAIHRKGKLRIVGLSGSITKFHVLTDAALLSPLKSGHNNSSCETVAPSSLGFWHGGEPDDNQTGMTTLDSSIAPLLEVSSCDGLSANSETAFSVGDTYSDGRQDDSLDTSSILGELYIKKPFTFLEGNKDIHGKDNEIKSIDKIVSAAGDMTTIDIGATEVDNSLATVHESLCASAGIVDNAFALIRKVTQLLSNCVKIIFSSTRLRPKRCSLVQPGYRESSSRFKLSRFEVI